MFSSHSNRWGVSSLSTQERIDSRSSSCSSVKMKCLRCARWSGLITLEVAVATGSLSFARRGSVRGGSHARKVDCRTSYFLLLVCPLMGEELLYEVKDGVAR